MTFRAATCRSSKSKGSDDPRSILFKCLTIQRGNTVVKPPTPFRTCLPIVVFLLISPLFVSAQETSEIKPGSYEPNWNSLDSRPTPDWYQDAKFGIFIHWNVSAVPAYAPAGQGEYAEWYWKRLRDEEDPLHSQFEAFHNRMFGPDVSYVDLASQFKAKQFSARKWAKLFKNSGARYVVLVSKHHDGYALWPSKYSWNWNAVDVGPGKDLLGALTKAVRKQGLRMGFYYSLYEWFNPMYRENVKAYVKQHMIPQMKELVNTYKPDVLWTDGEWSHPASTWRSREFLTWLFNKSPVRKDVAVNDRWGENTRGKHGGFFTSEYGSNYGAKNDSGESQAVPIWEETRGIGDSFGYNRMEEAEHYTSTRLLVKLLVRTVSRGGNLLLNIGPRADGRIPPIMEERLQEIGRWLNVNGEAIYGTDRWTAPSSDHPKIQYSRKGNTGYVHLLTWPGDTLQLKNVQTNSKTTISFLGRSPELDWSTTEKGIEIDIPPLTVDEIPSRHVQVLKIENLGQ